MTGEGGGCISSFWYHLARPVGGEISHPWLPSVSSFTASCSNGGLATGAKPGPPVLAPNDLASEAYPASSSIVLDAAEGFGNQAGDARLRFVVPGRDLRDNVTDPWLECPTREPESAGAVSRRTTSR